jgi:hypothetical protein
MKHSKFHLSILMIVAVLFSACQFSPLKPTATLPPTSTTTPESTSTPVPTDTEVPTDTPAPTDTPEPTATLVPSDTPAPTDTVEVTKISEADSTKDADTAEDEKETEQPDDNEKVDTGDVKPESLLAQSSLVMTQVKTFKFNMDVTSEVGGEDITIKAEGRSETPDKTYMKMELMGQEIEMLIISKTEAYMRTSDAKEWQAIPADQLKNSGGANPDVLGQIKIGDLVNDMTLDDTETINGEKCYRITYTMDMEKYFKKAAAGQPTQGLDFENSSAEGTIWIGVKDLRTYQYEMVMTMEVQGQEMTVITTIEFYDFNEPVEFPNPK